jgi:hypothetical protein
MRGMLTPEWELKRQLSRRLMSLTVSMLFGGCLVELGSTAIDVSEVLRRYGNIGASGMKTSRTGPRRPFTIFLLTELTRCEHLLAVSTIPPRRKLISVAGRASGHRVEVSGQHDLLCMGARRRPRPLALVHLRDSFRMAPNVMFGGWATTRRAIGGAGAAAPKPSVSRQPLCYLGPPHQGDEPTSGA